MADLQSVAHRPGPLKQQNKPHKHGKHKSKGQMSSMTKGRVSVKVMAKKARREMRKADRRNQARQLRSNKRLKAVMAKRAIGSEGTPPHLIVVLSLSCTVDPPHLHSLLCAACDPDAETPPPFSSLSTLVSPTLKQRFTLAFPNPSNLYAFLDIAKVADTLLLVYSAGEEVEPSRQLCLDCCCAQGLPATCHTALGLGSLAGKQLAAARKAMHRVVEGRFPGEKAHSMDSPQDALVVLRSISAQHRRRVSSRDQHPHLLVHSSCFQPSEGSTESGEWLVSGYLRARTLSANSLVHIPGLGDFQMAQIDAPPDPHPVKPRRRKDTGAGDMLTDAVRGEEEMEEGVRVLQVADSALQESLQMEVQPDPMEGEQTWPTEEELQEAEAAARSKRGGDKVRRRVPRGVSDYQATWILDSDSEEGSELSSEDGDVPAVLPVSDEEGGSEGTEEMSVAESDTLTLPGTDQYDDQLDLEGEHMQLKRLRAEREHQMFPDEVDTPLDIPARTRFQKYRGLKSFRSSPWDPRENLPSNYARIFQFENFSRTKKRVLKREEEEGALPGWYITVHISSVPRRFAESQAASPSPLVIYGLLQHENKMSVVHYVLRRTPNYTLPIKSKDQLIFHSGVRRFSACPIFSQHTSGDKHKYERFLSDGAVSVATVYCPIGYPPQPVLVFKAEQDAHVLVATGSLYKVDPLRVVCKRIVLSGHPLKINKRSVVVRYLFFNREDILWFKPVELRTKYGRSGHIKEPLGTHGHMKCRFDRPLKAQDTVLLYLYKRVYPKWSYSMDVPLPAHWSVEKPDSTD